MKKSCVTAAGLLCIALCAADKYGIPAFNELSPQELMPKGEKVMIAPNGDVLKNGKPHYFLGTQIGNNLAFDLAKTNDTPAELSWLYEQPLTFEAAQRLGFDTLSTFNLPTHALRFNKTAKHFTLQDRNVKLYTQMLNARLPFYMDFSEFLDSNGILAHRRLLPAEAINQYRNTGDNHFFAYNPNHPVVREVFKAMIEDCITRTRASNVSVLAYELFNEPAYNDPSPYNRKLFAEYLKKQYGSIEALNKVYGASYPSFEAVSQFQKKTDHHGIFIDWSKFLEKCFTDYFAYGKDVVLKNDPKGYVTLQIMGYDYYRCLYKSNVNMYEISKRTNAVTVPTGGGVAGACMDFPAKHAIETPLSVKGEGMLMRHFFRNLSEGKVQINSELYCGKTHQELLRAVWLDYLRGASVSYLFSWGKRGWEWPKYGGKRLAEMYPYSLMNPYAQPPELLRRYRDVKNEIIAFNDFFASRERNVKREVAVLLSFPTERYAAAKGNYAKNDITIYTSALEFAHYPIDAILEEQLPEGRADRYKAIVACGTSNIYPGTVKAITDYVSKGGILIIGRSVMENDEYGNKLDWKGVFNGLELKDNPAAPQSSIILQEDLKQPGLLPGNINARGVLDITATGDWKQTAAVGGKTAVAYRRLGKGFIYVIGTELQDYPAAALLGAILEKHDIKPLLDLKMKESGELAVNVETHVSRRGERTAVFCMNFDNYPKLVCLDMKDLKGKKAYDLLNKKALPLSKDGALFLLPAGSRAIIGIGPENAFGKYPAITEKMLEKLYNAEAESIKKARRSKKSFSYSPDLSRTVPLDMRKFYNRRFIDTVAGDGKGGWTDQGMDNSLLGVPWGVNKFAGVPCEIVRFDQNANRTCLVMASKSVEGDLPAEVKDIPVKRKAKALYFFHCIAWGSEREELALTYKINYADGTAVEHKAITGVNIADWWISPRAKQVAWKNVSNKGFHIDRWLNRTPEKEIRSIDIISPNTKIVPIVIAISVEETDPSSQLDLWPLSHSSGFGLKMTYEERSGELTTHPDGNTGDWAGINIENRNFGKSPVHTPNWNKGYLLFEIKGGPDRYGNLRDGEKLQITLASRGKDGKLSSFSPVIRFAEFAEDGKIPAELFTVVKIPLDRFTWPKGEKSALVNLILVQFGGNGKSAGGYTIRNLRFEIPQK
ncbi:MAG: beta-galactosidase [Lentisphaeria bacterium]|nr:beta-galactosidase [Lentisphaeria bacterium]